MKLQLSTRPEIQTRLERECGSVIPTGSAEQHGPTGLIGTDAIRPETIAGDLPYHGVLVGPTLSNGMAQHHMALPDRARKTTEAAPGRGSFR